MGISLDPTETLDVMRYLSPVSWRCSMVWSAYMGMPLSLEGAGAVLGLEKQKLTEGKELIRYFCKPCNPTIANGKRIRNLPEHAPDKWEVFRAYNIRDVETEMSIQIKLAKFPVPDEVWDEYALDQEINDRGVQLDMTLVKNAITIDTVSRSELLRKIQQLTELDNPNSVARVKLPGIKFDNVPVLNGPQGIGKSMAISRLGREWYSDSLSISDMKDKTAPEKLQGNWLLELSEMAGIKKMDVETVKSFASRIDDKYRPSYGRVVESHPRQCIIIGTTNNDGGFLRDVTGNRRFWPIRVTGEGKKHPWDLTEKEVDQIWAEAIALFEAGEELYLKGDVAVAAADEQRGAMENDDREGLVIAYLEALLPESWDIMDIYARQEYFRSPDDPTKPIGITRRVQVSNMEIWCECFGRHRDALKKTDSYEIEAIVNSIGGWERYTGSKTGKKNIPLYGPQKIYVRGK